MNKMVSIAISAAVAVAGGVYLCKRLARRKHTEQVENMIRNIVKDYSSPEQPDDTIKINKDMPKAPNIDSTYKDEDIVLAENIYYFLSFQPNSFLRAVCRKFGMRKQQYSNLSKIQLLEILKNIILDDGRGSNIEPHVLRNWYDCMHWLEQYTEPVNHERSNEVISSLTAPDQTSESEPRYTRKMSSYINSKQPIERSLLTDLFIMWVFVNEPKNYLPVE